MQKSTITIDVNLDENKIPEQINWSANNTSAEAGLPAKAVMLSLWDGNEKAALRIDLWTKDMMVDEMADFFYQTFMGMADTYSRATQYQDLTDDIKKFAKEFIEKFNSKQFKENKA